MKKCIGEKQWNVNVTFQYEAHNRLLQTAFQHNTFLLLQMLHNFYW